MGAKARKENNERSRQIFQSATDQYNLFKNPTQVENDLRTAYQGYQNPTELENRYKDRSENPFDVGEEDTYRSRALSPIQSAYGHDADEIKRQAALHGGAPNLIAALAKSKRNLNQSVSDATMKANADLLSEKDRRINEALSGLTHEQDVRNQLAQNTLFQLSQAEAARRQAELQSLGIASGVKPIEGFGWGKLGSALGNIATFGLTHLGGGGGGQYGNSDRQLYGDDYQDYPMYG